MSKIALRSLVAFICGLILVFNGFDLFGQGEKNQTIYFNIPSKGTGMKSLIFQQNIDGVVLNQEDTSRCWQLYQEIDGEWIKKRSQIDKNNMTLLYGNYTDSDRAGEVLKFRWRQEEISEPEDLVSLKDNGKEIIFEYKDQALVTYRYKMMPVPERVSPVFRWEEHTSDLHSRGHLAC